MENNMDGYEASVTNYPGSPQGGTGTPAFNGGAGTPVFSGNTGAPESNGNAGTPAPNGNGAGPGLNGDAVGQVPIGNAAGPVFDGSTAGPVFDGNAAGPLFNGNAAGPVLNGSAAGPALHESTGGVAPNANTAGAPFQGNTGIPSSQDTAGGSAPQAARKEPAKKKFSLREWVPGPQVPNQLTIGRICMIPLFVILILWVPKPAGNILSMIVFIIASLTDTLDGYIARRYNYVSTFGKFMDPLADKLLVCSALICLVDIGRIESWIVIIIIAREFIISGFRLVAVEKGVVIAANIWGKVKTVFQMLMVILMLGNFQGFLGVTAQILKWFALALTIISLATYLLQNRKVLQDQV
jgi:CDP-diacylglycerol--glycerol-3-phosphate 3-phosphatidyltransferase